MHGLQFVGNDTKTTSTQRSGVWIFEITSETNIQKSAKSGLYMLRQGNNRCVGACGELKTKYFEDSETTCSI